MAEMQASMPGAGRLRWIASTVVVLSALAILLSLGTWQMQRLGWKEKLLSDIAERRVAAPATLVQIETLERQGDDIEYRPVTVTGTFLHGHERHFFATWQGRSGFYVYTPLALADERVVFVNRGFVPYENKAPETRAEGQLAGPQTVTGLARAKLDAKPSWVVPENDPAGNVFYWKDIDAMAQSAGVAPQSLVPFFIDAGDAPNPGGMPVGGVTLFELPNNHLQYALTWYGLAFALVVVTGFFVFRRK